MLFDLRTMSRPELLVRLDHAERLYGKLKLTRNADETLSAEPIPQPTSTSEGLAQFGKKVFDVANKINLSGKLTEALEKPKMSNLTGATFLGGTIKDTIAQAKAKIGAATEKFGAAKAKMDGAVETVTKIADQVNTEADDLVSSVAQLTNGAPE